MTVVSRWVAAIALLAGSVVAASPSSAQGTPDLDLSDVGFPVRIGITTAGPDGPDVTSTVVNTVQEAVQLIVNAQGDPSTVAVGVSQPVTIDAKRDTYRSDQWALSTLGAEKAWRKSTGSGVVVAVVDTGVYSSHPDLRGHVLKGVDLVDRGTGAGDANGHGTHVSGVISAVTGNGKGIAGLAYNAKILPVRVLDSQGNGETVDVAEGVIWAVKHGADVINMSLSSTGNDPNLRAAVAYAASKNVVVVAAAGNDGCGSLLGLGSLSLGSVLGLGSLFGSPSTYPAAYPDVVGVGSIDSDRSVSSFSSCGNWVDVVAPGGKILSTMMKHSDPNLGCAAAQYYCYLSGTSMATPHAAAAAALSIARMGKKWRASTVRSQLESTADDIGTSGKDKESGAGVINLGRLIARS